MRMEVSTVSPRRPVTSWIASEFCPAAVLRKLRKKETSRVLLTTQFIFTPRSLLLKARLER